MLEYLTPLSNDIRSVNSFQEKSYNCGGKKQTTEKKKNTQPSFSPCPLNPSPSHAWDILSRERTEVRVDLCGNERRGNKTGKDEKKGNFQSSTLNLKTLKKLDSPFYKFMYIIMQCNSINSGFLKTLSIFTSVHATHTFLYITNTRTASNWVVIGFGE